MSILDTLSADVQAAWSWAQTELATGEAWVKGEMALFSAGFLAQIKLEIPAVEHAFVSGLQDLISQVVQEVETEFSASGSGDIKFSTALSRVFTIVETAGIAGLSAVFSTSAKETAIQLIVSALKAGLLATGV